MIERPLVSFILISYKHERFIRDCMKSLVAQTYSNMEILYLDDASQDGTFQKASEYKEILAEKYQNVVFIENSRNCGLVHNLNRLVQLSQGKYVKFLAADDFMLDDGIEKMVCFLENHPECDMVYTNGITGEEQTHYPIENIQTYIPIYREIPPSGNSLLDLLYENDFISAPGVMIRHTVYDKLGLYDENIGVEDWDYFLRIAKNGNIGYLAEPTVMYRVLPSSLSHSSLPNRRMNMKKSELMILEKYKDNATNASSRMGHAFNEALSDAFHIDNKEYLSYLYLYARRNNIRITLHNWFKRVLYNTGIIKVFEKWSNGNGGINGNE